LIVGPDGTSLGGDDQDSYGVAVANAAGHLPECWALRAGSSPVPVSIKVSCFISCSQRMYAALLQDLSAFKRLQESSQPTSLLQAVDQLTAGAI
jgi:hypothetical protein